MPSKSLCGTAPAFVPEMTVAIPKIPFVPLVATTPEAMAAAEKLELARIEQFLKTTFGAPLPGLVVNNSPLVNTSILVQGEDRDSVRACLTFNDLRACDRALRELDETPFPIPQGFPFRGSTFHVWRLRVRRIVLANEQSEFWRPSRLVTVGGIPDDKVGALVLDTFKSVCVHGILSSRLDRDPLVEEEEDDFPDGEKRKEDGLQPQQQQQQQQQQSRRLLPKDRAMTLQVLLRTIDDLAAVMKQLQGYPVKVPEGFWCHGMMTKSYRFVIHVVFVTNDKKRWSDLDVPKIAALSNSNPMDSMDPAGVVVSNKLERRHGPLWASKTLAVSGLHLLTAAELLMVRNGGPPRVVPSPLYFESPAQLSSFIESLIMQLCPTTQESREVSEIIDSMTIVRPSSQNSNLNPKTLSLLENLKKLPQAPRSLCTFSSNSSSHDQAIPHDGLAGSTSSAVGVETIPSSKSSRGIPEDTVLPTAIPFSSDPVYVLIQLKTSALASEVEKKFDFVKTNTLNSSSSTLVYLRNLSVRGTVAIEAEQGDACALLEDAEAYSFSPSSPSSFGGENVFINDECSSRSKSSSIIIPPAAQLLGYDLVVSSSSGSGGFSLKS